jgi:hypothetical protein
LHAYPHVSEGLVWSAASRDLSCRLSHPSHSIICVRRRLSENPHLSQRHLLQPCIRQPSLPAHTWYSTSFRHHDRLLLLLLLLLLSSTVSHPRPVLNQSRRA